MSLAVALTGATLVTKVLVPYAAAMTTLYVWERHALPRVQDVLPVPVFPGRFRQSERDLPWITPLDAEQSVPLPRLDELTVHRVGSHRTSRNSLIGQFVRRAGPDDFFIRGEVEKSAAWSKHYGTSIVIFKKRMTRV